MEEIRNQKGQFIKGFKKTKEKAIISTVYGNYTVICDQLYFTQKDTHVHFKVKCKCGKIMIVRAQFLKNGKRHTCKKCVSKERYWEARKLGKKVGFITHHIGVGNLTKSAYSYFKRNASRRDLIWELDINFLWDLFISQNKKCALSGLDLEMTEKRSKHQGIDWNLMTASLDRIDSSKGYTKDNVQWLHKEINRLKNNYNQDHFIQMCKLIAKNEIA